MTFNPDVVEASGYSLHLIFISFIGGWILWGYKLKLYFDRPVEDRMTSCRAFFLYFGLFLWLPALGGFVSWIYIVNGDKMSALLALQVGLTSPAILHGFISVGANASAANPIEVDSEA